MSSDSLCPEGCNALIVEDPQTGFLICTGCGLEVSSETYTNDLVPAYQHALATQPFRSQPFPNARHAQLPNMPKKIRQGSSNKIQNLLKKYQWANIISYEAKMMIRLFTIIKNTISNLELSQRLLDPAVERMIQVVKKIPKKTNKNYLALACIFSVSKELKIFIKIEQLAEYMDLKPRRLRTLSYLIDDLLNVSSSVITPLDVLQNITDWFPDPAMVTPDVRQLAERILALPRPQTFNPRGWAAAAVYLAANHYNIRITQRTLAASLYITDVTIRARIHDLHRAINQKRIQLNNEGLTPTASSPARRAEVSQQ